MAITKKIHKISLIVEANTNQLRSVSNQFKDLEREIGRVAGKVDLLATKQNVYTKKTTASTKASTKAMSTMSNSVVRHIRQLESLVVALYAVHRAYGVTLGRGHEFNKLIERETIGLKLLIAQNLKNVDVTGKAVTAVQKYSFAQKEAARIIREVRKVNLETPQTLGETLQIYKLLTPQVKRYGGSVSDISEITKNLSIVTSAMGIEFQQYLKTVDSALSGDKAESALKRSLEQFGITNKLIKETYGEKGGAGVIKLFKDNLKSAALAGEEIAGSWAGVTSKFTNAWDEMWGEIQKPLFSAMEEEIKLLSISVNENSKDITKTIHNVSSVIASLATPLKLIVNGFLAWKVLVPLIASGSKALAVFRWNVKLVSLAVRQSNGTMSAMGITATVLGVRLRALGLVLKSMFMTNLPMIAMIAAFETWIYVTGKASDEQDKLEKSLLKTNKQLVEMTDTIFAQNKLRVDESYRKEIGKIYKAIVDLNNIEKKYARGLASKEDVKVAQDLVEQYGKQAVAITDIKSKYDEMEDLRDKGIAQTKIASKEASNVALSVSEIVKQLLKASRAAFDLKINLIDSADALGATLREFKVLTGAMSSTQNRIITATKAVRVEQDKVNLLKERWVTLGEKEYKNATEQKKIDAERLTIQKSVNEAIIKLEQAKNNSLKVGIAITNETLTKNLKSVELSLKEASFATTQTTAKAKQLESLKLEVRLKKAALITAGKMVGDENKMIKVREAALALAKAEKNVRDVENRLPSGDAGSKLDIESSKEIGVSLKLAELAVEQYRLEKAINGEILTRNEENALSLALAIKEVEEAEKAYKFALSLAGLGARTDKKVLEAKLRLTVALREEQEELNKEADEWGEILQSSISDSLKSLSKGDFKSAFNSMATAMEKPFNDVIDNISTRFANMLSGSTDAFKGFSQAIEDIMNANPYMLMLSIFIKALQGGLFNDTVSQEEIDAAKGRVEFDEESLISLGEMYADAQYPMLEVTNKMHKHIRNMDANFYSVARALAGQASMGGVDITGVNFAETSESGFLGFSSKTVSHLSSGLAFELQNLGELMNSAELDVRGYTTSLVEKSSWWGLSSSSSIQTSYQDLPSSVVNDIANAFDAGFNAILAAGVSLGLDSSQLMVDLLAAEIDLGKIDFTGLSPDEISERLSQAFSEAFSGVISGIDGLYALTDRYAQGSEYALETLGRIALEFDQASHLFMLIGKDFADGGITQIAQQFENIREVTDEQLGWWEQILSGDYSGFDSVDSGGWVENLFGKIKGAEESWEQFVTRMVDTTYTAQMQILDIVESTGGLQAFNDAMGAFMGNFYTDAEQLGFLTKSMEASFNTLGIAMPQTNDEFRTLLEGMDTTTEEGAYLYGQVLLLAESFAVMTDEAGNLGVSMEQMIQNVSDAWLGNLSYLTLAQKADYASGLLKLGLTDASGSINTVDAARAAAEIALRTAATKEEYIPVFEKYIAELEKEVQDSTNTDIVNAIRDMKIGIVEDLGAIITKAAIYGSAA